MSEFHLFDFSSYLKSWQLMDAFLECFYKNEKYLFKMLKNLFFTFTFSYVDASENLILADVQNNSVVSAVARQDSSPSLTVNSFRETCCIKLYFYECIDMFKETAVLMLFL